MNKAFLDFEFQILAGYKEFKIILSCYVNEFLLESFYNL
jgi:hypothetical protein